MSGENQERMSSVTLWFLASFVLLLGLGTAFAIGELAVVLGFGETLGIKRSDPSERDMFWILFCVIVGFAGSWVILYHYGWSLRRYFRAFAVGVGFVFFMVVILFPAWDFLTDPIVERLADQWLSRGAVESIRAGLMGGQ
jgi:hypothetical protein